MGAAIHTRRVAELPLKDGNPVMLANLSPGVLNFTTGGWTMASAVGAPSAIRIDGVRSGNNGGIQPQFRAAVGILAR